MSEGFWDDPEEEEFETTEEALAHEQARKEYEKKVAQDRADSADVLIFNRTWLPTPHQFLTCLTAKGRRVVGHLEGRPLSGGALLAITRGMQRANVEYVCLGNVRKDWTP